MEQDAYYGVMHVCVDAIAGAPEEEYHILSKFNIFLVIVICMRNADNVIAIFRSGNFPRFAKIDVFSILEGTPPLAGESDVILIYGNVQADS